jgi:hypothetical protein
MLVAAAAGVPMDRAEGTFDLAAMKAWGQGRTVRAAVLLHLLVDEEWPVHSKGVQLSGIRISGHLDLEAATLRCPLRVQHCYFSSPRPVNFNYTSASLLTFTGCHLAGLRGDLLTVSKELDLTSSTFTSQLRLLGADIAGTLSCRGARFTGADSDGNALVADRMKAGSVLLDEEFTAAGAVRLAGADITGQLYCGGARLTSADSDGNALVADGARIGGDMFLDQEFTAVGTLSLRSARIDGSLSLRPSGLADVDEKPAIDATGAQIAHTLLWSPSQQITGLVILEDATVGQLTDHWTQDAGPVNGYWPSAATGKLRLDGFTYTRTGGPYLATLEQRLAWIGSHSERTAASTRTRFASQPYEQLAQVYQQAGQDKEARKVAIARRRDLRRYGELSRLRKLGNWLLEKTIQYGYQTWRAVAGIIVLYGAVLVFLWFARYHNAFIPVQTIVGLHPVPTATSCTSHYPCFNPFGYAIDTVIPLINVHQADFWGPNESDPWGTACVVVTYVGTGFGWILATLAVAGYTGLARNTDAP